MKIYDISQELFSGKVYPGDPTPSYERILKIAEGDSCNLTTLQMGAHNATHLDAPYHFYEEGNSIEQLDLTRCIGPCTVINLSVFDREEFIKILKICNKRLLLKGTCTVTLEMAQLLNEFKIVLVGVESQSVGSLEDPGSVHLELLSNEVVLLEGIVLEEVIEGEYFLFAAPLKLGKSDGAPCRAILMEKNEFCTCNFWV